MSSHLRRGIWLVLVFALANLGCSKEKASSVATEAAQPSQSAPANPPVKPVEPAGPAMHVDAVHAMQYTKEIVAFGPRWDGSKALDQVRAYIKNKLKGDQVEEDAFVAETSIGKVPMRNIIAKFPGSKDGIIVLASHYETNYWLKDTTFAGANDGAATTALLLAIADQLRGKKLEGYSVWLAFFDGEESITRKWNTADALWGSRHLAKKWQDDGTSKKIKAFLLADMIGDADLGVFRDENSTPWLEDLVLQAATRLGYQSFFFHEVTAVEDDHLPFVHAGMPVADIIDGNYGYHDSFHHTVEDTVDKLSVKSLQVSGDVILETIRLVNGMGENPPPPTQKVPS
ncbi:MAG TPA: M28 family peptidase [Candidatus Sulfotelmatobacter sp.]|nr:M28 family peptidase [Candidatus Sulfotelmatobacter sp.]